MAIKKYTIQSTFSEITQVPVCRDLVYKIAPELIEGNTSGFLKNTTMTILANSTSGSKSKFVPCLNNLPGNG